MTDLDTSADVVDLPLGPGRPPGGKKTCGRKLGSKNRRTKEVEAVLRPLIPGAKKKIRALLESEIEETAMKAVQMLFAYVFGKPVDRREVSGPDGQPFEEPLSDFDLARRIMLVFGRAGLVSEPDHTVAANEFAEAARRSQESTDAPDGPEGPPRRLPRAARPLLCHLRATATALRSRRSRHLRRPARASGLT